jgi:hypothetical protein
VVILCVEQPKADEASSIALDIDWLEAVYLAPPCEHRWVRLLFPNVWSFIRSFPHHLEFEFLVRAAEIFEIIQDSVIVREWVVSVLRPARPLEVARSLSEDENPLAAAGLLMRNCWYPLAFRAAEP